MLRSKTKGLNSDGKMKGAHSVVRFLMPRVLPLTVWRQLEGTPPENWFWLTFNVCSSLSEDHDGGSVPVRVLLLRFTFVRCVLPDHDAGRVPAHARQKPSESAE